LLSNQDLLKIVKLNYGLTFSPFPGKVRIISSFNSMIREVLKKFGRGF